MSWNAAGPRGAKGAHGLPGKPGKQGIQGVAGPGAQQIVLSTTDLTTGADTTIYPFQASNVSNGAEIQGSCGMVTNLAATQARVTFMPANLGTDLNQGTGTTDLTLGIGGSAFYDQGPDQTALTAGFAS